MMKFLVLMAGLSILVYTAMTHEKRRGVVNLLIYGAGLGMTAATLKALIKVLF